MQKIKLLSINNVRRSKTTDLKIFLLIYLQIGNVITGPDIILKFLGYRFVDVSEIGLGWFTSTINILFVILGLSVLVHNSGKSFQILSKCRVLLIILLIIFISVIFISEEMVGQSVTTIALTVGYFIKIFSLIVLFDKYKFEFTTVLLKVVKALTILMVIYLLLYFNNGFSTTLIGRYQSFLAQPNSLGQFSSLVILLLLSERLYFSKMGSNRINNFSFLFFLIIAIIFVIMSQSFTNLLIIAVLIGLYFFYKMRIKLVNLLLVISVFLFSAFFLTKVNDLSFLSFFDNATIEGNFNRDLTLTGRTQIWRDVLDKVEHDNKTFLGYGLSGFWGKGASPSSTIDNPLFAEIGQSHNGFIELYTQFGLLGLLLFIYSISKILSILKKIHSKDRSVYFIYFFISFFIFNNLVESSYLQPKNFLNFIFILIIIKILIFKSNSYYYRNINFSNFNLSNGK